jgi:predicted GNAT family N-acyltransferase
LATGSGSQQIVGYYSLSSHTIALEGIDAASRKKLPRYPLVPTTLIGRLARDLRFRGERVGELLLLDALSRAVQISGQVGSHAVTVDAIDAEAIAFYVKYGFISLIGHPNRLYLPMVSIKKLRL